MRVKLVENIDCSLDFNKEKGAV